MTAPPEPVPPAARLWWLLAIIAEPMVRLLLWHRSTRGRELPDRIGERRGHATLPRPQGRLLWLHAASVGEAVSVLALLDSLCANDPDLHVLMTTGSVTSQRLLAQRLRAADLDRRVLQQFVPLDVPRWLRRFLRHWRPQAVALVESELWPNLIACVRSHGLPIALVNARLSARSFRGWRRLPALARTMLRSFCWITARSQEDADRLRRLGAPRVGCPGDLKAAAAALPVDERELDRLRRMLAGRPLWLAASTHAGEEAVIAQAHAILSRRLPTLLTIIAPRHPQRGAALPAPLDRAPRRSLGQDPAAGQAYWICDTMGELGLLYRLSPITFLGNSLSRAAPEGGGHNPFEPARLGCAIATGPLTFNFNDAVAALRDAGAIEIAPTAEAIADWAFRLLSDPAARARQVAAAERIARAASDLVPALARRLLDLAGSG